jgi:hypothetical protein
MLAKNLFHEHCCIIFSAIRPIDNGRLRPITSTSYNPLEASFNHTNVEE